MAERRWERLKSRAQALVDSTGKILGYVEESVLQGYFSAYHEANTLGRYIDDRSAKLAVEVAVDAPKIDPLQLRIINNENLDA